jgi:hypothetical protein
MADILNDEKHIILTKKEYDKLEELARGVVDSYEKKINKLQETVENLEKGKPYITYTPTYLYSLCGPTITYLDNTEDARVVNMFKEEKERELNSQEKKFRKEIRNMTILGFIRKRRECKESVFEELEKKWDV